MFYRQGSRILKRALQFTARRLCAGVNNNNNYTLSSGEHRSCSVWSGLMPRAVLTECTRATSLFILTSGLHYSKDPEARSEKGVIGMEVTSQDVHNRLSTTDEGAREGAEDESVQTANNGQTSTHEIKNEDDSDRFPAVVHPTVTEVVSGQTTIVTNLFPMQNTTEQSCEDGNVCTTRDCSQILSRANEADQIERLFSGRDNGADNSSGPHLDIARCPFSDHSMNIEDVSPNMSDRSNPDSQSDITHDSIDTVIPDNNDHTLQICDDLIHSTGDEGPVMPNTKVHVTSANNDPVTPAITDHTSPSNKARVTATYDNSKETPANDARALGGCTQDDPLRSSLLPDEPPSFNPATAIANEADPGSDGDIVVVTGGSGFLGQHIVKQIHERADHVTEIWIYDVKPFEQKLDYRPTKKVKSIVGSVTDAGHVMQSLKGATSVIHVAGLISWGTFPDVAGMQEVNVKGTQNVLNACRENNIQRLIYCSTVDVAIGTQPIRGGDETNTPVPDKFLFPGYPETKFQGERIVLGSRHDKHNGGQRLQTVILRANVCYGELDQSYVTNALRAAKKKKGILNQIGDGRAMFQQVYVGNTAWAFVCADRAMKEKQELDREIFYIPDNTPIQNSFNFMRPYLEANGLQLSAKPISYPLVHRAVWVMEKIVKGLSPLLKIDLPFQSHTIAYINTDFYFCGSKARKLLNFEPIYSSSEARVMSMKYYTSIDLDKDPTTS